MHDERLSECSMIRPFIDVGGEAIQLLATALGRLLLGVDEPNPQARYPGISDLPPVRLSASLELVTGDEADSCRPPLVLSRPGSCRQAGRS
jgi:hypothetical protein